MFYPVDSLRKGGRFYFCWVADSWPLQFATLTHRQLMSQDIRKICDDLIELIRNESGRPANRFSLRLSSQLMRGVVRLYQKKVSIFLNDLCMSHAYILKLANKKFGLHELPEPRERRRLSRPLLILPPPEEDQPQRVEEMLQNSGNVVANIQDITLREAAIPEIQLPPNDNFGEENPERALLGLDKTMEIMLAGLHPQSAASALELDKSLEKSLDKSRLEHGLLQMENISELNQLNATTFRRSDGEGLLPVADFEKEIPEISDIPIPEPPAPQDKQPQALAEMPSVIDPTVGFLPHRENENIELEELEEVEPRAKRRRRGLIIDRNIKLSSSYIRERIANPHVELRCMNSAEERVSLQVPSTLLLRRPATRQMALVLTRMFQRNLGHLYRPSAEREIVDQEIVRQPQPTLMRSGLEPIQEDIVREAPHVLPENLNQDISAANQDMSTMNMTNIDQDLSNILHLTNIDQNMPLQDIGNITKDLDQQDISNALTQKLETLSQARKRSGENYVSGPSPKRLRSSVRRSSHAQRRSNVEIDIGGSEVIPEIQGVAQNIPEGDKENIPGNMQIWSGIEALLSAAGLSEDPPRRSMDPLGPATERRASRGSDEETPLGSVDRTKVSLGDSESTTTSKRFLQDEWGTQGTLIKIIKLIKARETVNIPNLLKRGPVIPGHKARIAALCFHSILRLKQHGFVKVIKEADSLEIAEIRLGPLFN